MLVLSRKIGERILLGNGVVVTVLNVTGGRVRLGIEAPQAVRILREELADPSQDPREAPSRSGSGSRQTAMGGS
jgi:carbon storage regulator